LDENTLLLHEQACRRAFERTAVDVPVMLISTHRGTTSFHEARTADLCEGGMGVVTSAPLTPHQSISIEIVVPLANQLLKLNAVIKHQRSCPSMSGDCYGLEFYAATEAQRKQLKRMAYDS
jgi:c-di-GMP-binding flagellar brake protein YcgR